VRKEILALGLAAGLLMAGCVVAPPYPPAPAAPPPTVYQAYPDQYGEPPPPLPIYEQPPVPAEGYLWSPGFWRASPAGYFWVPGTWVLPPAPGLLWTPGYWALGGSAYVFHPGYWAPHVGYYGGINYGHGYFGNGYAGGRWVNNRFSYNTAVTNVNQTNIHNTYNQTVVNNTNVTNITNVTRVSYVGGPNTRAQPTPEEATAAHERHLPPTPVQVQHENAARAQPDLDARRNQGRPPIAATPRPAQFGSGATPAQPAAPMDRPGVRPGSEHEPPDPPMHARDLPKSEPMPAPPAAGPNEPQPRANQADLRTRHEQERQALAQQQAQERANFAKQPVQNEQAYEAMEKRHQQQTQQLQQRHQQENQQHGSKNDAGSGEPEPPR